MKRIYLVIVVSVFSICALSLTTHGASSPSALSIKLPEPVYEGKVSVEKALKERRSVRAYKAEPLTMADVSQLLWAAQGVTEPTKGLRTAPSPKSIYLLEVYVISGSVKGLPAGLYKYQPVKHELLKIAGGEVKERLYAAASQAPIKNAPAALVITGYHKKSVNPGWIYLEAGHTAQNVYLEAVSLDLGTVAMAGFKPDEVKKALGLSDEEQPIYIMPVGKK